MTTPLFFVASHMQWNITAKPPSMLSKQIPPAISTNLLERARYSIHIPLDDTYDELCLVPDLDDGSVTYTRLFDALHEYYHNDPRRIQSLGKFTEFGGVVVFPLGDRSRLVVNMI